MHLHKILILDIIPVPMQSLHNFLKDVTVLESEILLGSEQLQNMILLYLDIILYTRKTCYCSHDVRPTTHIAQPY